MKFFDLEMGDCLAKATSKKGGRDVSWPNANSYNDHTCSYYKFTNGYTHETCMSNTYKDSNNDLCGTHYSHFK